MEMIKILVLALLWATALAAPAEDLVTDLPGLDFPITFNQYSGYLNGTEGRKLHYWFVESKSDPTTDPLVLWLNGGPGCSSLMGFLTELGPFRVSEDGSGSLVSNIYSWNNAANVIFLESPACVGFSYDVNNNCATGDDEVAEMNYLALQEFFAKFPEYDGREFYITGESYGGVYVPTLSVKVVEGNPTFPINFQGYAVGNGLLSYKNNDNGLLFFAFYHALLGQTQWDNMIAACCDDGVESQATCDFSGSTDLNCELLVLNAFNIIYNGGLNIYGLYNDCVFPTSSLKTQRGQYSIDAENVFRRLQEKYGSPVPFSDPPCTDNSLEREYLNTPEVREALHIAPEADDWDVCSDEVGNYYNREYDTTVPQLAFLQESGIRGLIYNGDTDMACNVMGNEWDVTSIGLTPLDIFKKWEVGGQVAGYFVSYENLDFLTVRGSGHMVPEDKPEEALHMITAFLNNKPYDNLTLNYIF